MTVGRGRVGGLLIGDATKIALVLQDLARPNHGVGGLPVCDAGQGAGAASSGR